MTYRTKDRNSQPTIPFPRGAHEAAVWVHSLEVFVSLPYSNFGLDLAIVLVLIEEQKLFDGDILGIGLQHCN